MPLQGVSVDMLLPLRSWVIVAATCALILSAEALLLLALPARWSWRRWIGLGVLAVGIFAIAYGKWIYTTYHDLRPLALSLSHQGINCYGCESSAQIIYDALSRAETTGLLLQAATALTIAAGGLAGFFWLLGASKRHLAPSAALHAVRARLPRLVELYIGISFTDLGALVASEGAQFWMRTAYLADPVRQGDSLGVIPLYEAIVTTGMGCLSCYLDLASLQCFSRSKHMLARRKSSLPRSPTQ